MRGGSGRRRRLVGVWRMERRGDRDQLWSRRGVVVGMFMFMCQRLFAIDVGTRLCGKQWRRWSGCRCGWGANVRMGNGKMVETMTDPMSSMPSRLPRLGRQGRPADEARAAAPCPPLRPKVDVDGTNARGYLQTLATLASLVPGATPSERAGREVTHSTRRLLRARIPPPLHWPPRAACGATMPATTRPTPGSRCLGTSQMASAI